jgi:hypothetical protein
MRVARTAALWAALVGFVGVSGCSSGSSSGGQNNPAFTSACHDLCTVEGQGMGCPSSATQNCDQLCDVFGAAISASCAANGPPCFTCEKTLMWGCLSGGDIPVASAQPCTDQCAAWNGCLADGGR